MLENMPRTEFDRLLFESLRAIYRFEMAKERLFGISFMDIYLLQYLRIHSPRCMGDLAAEMNLPISTATRLVDRLEKKSFLGRRRDPKDRRTILVELKKPGLEMVRKVEDHSYEVIMENLERLGQEGTATYLKTAEAMPEILKTPSEATDGNGRDHKASGILRK